MNLTPQFGVKLSYLTFNDVYDYSDGGKGELKKINVQDLDNAITVGMDYSFKYYLPMKLSVEHSWAKPSRADIEDYRDFLISFNMLF